MLFDGDSNSPLHPDAQAALLRRRISTLRDLIQEQLAAILRDPVFSNGSCDVPVVEESDEPATSR